MRRLRAYQYAAASPAAAATRNVLLVPMTAVRVPPKAYPMALPVSPQLTSSAYDPVRVPGSVMSSSSALVVIPWTAPAAPHAGITSSIAATLSAAKARQAPAMAATYWAATRREASGTDHRRPP